MKADKRTAVFGVFATRVFAEQGLDSLRLSGFGNGEISALFPEGEAISGVVGWLAGIGPVTVPKVGLFLAAGPLVAALSRYGISGALSGIPNADHYEGRVREGAVLVVVHCSNHDRALLASEVLKRSHAEDVATPSIGHRKASA